jgi:MraZ protein
VNIPVRFKEYFQGELVITRGEEHCAMILTPSGWEQYEQAVENSNLLTHEQRNSFINEYLIQASQVEMDNAGRILIPPRIRQYANLTRNCTVVRDKDRLYIWDRDDYETYLEQIAPIARTAVNTLFSPNISRES